MISKKGWLDYLFYKIGKQQYDFKLCGLQKTEDRVKATKWRKFSEVIFPIDVNEDWKIKHINNREILPNEVVLDLEDKKQYPKVIERLKEIGWEFYAYETGSRGHHIHIFFNRAMTSEEKLKIIKEFGADEQKASNSCMIALENCPHWKTGKIKELIQWKQ